MARLEGVHGGRYSSAAGMTHDNDQSRSELGCGELDGPDDGRGDDISRDPHNEEVTETLVEENFDRGSRIGATENDGEWALCLRGESRAPCASHGSPGGFPEAAVSFHQACKPLLR